MHYFKNFIFTSIIAVSCLFSLHFDNYLVFIIPILIFLIFLDPLNTVYILISTILASIVFELNIHLELITICILTLFLRNLYLNKKVFQYLYIFFMMTISYLYYIQINNTYLILQDYLIYQIIGLLLYAILCFQTKSYFTNTYKLQLFNQYYYFTILSILMIISTSTLNIMYLPFSISIFSIFFLSSNKQFKLSFFLSIVVSYLFYFFFHLSIILILPVISIISFHKYNAFMISFLTLALYYYNQESLIYAIVIFIMTLLFELYQYYQHKSPLSEHNFTNTIYSNIITNFNDQILKYATFLDNFSKQFKESKDYKIKMDHSINHIIEKHCKKCPNAHQCFHENKMQLFRYLNLVIKYRDRIHFLSHNQEEKNFINSCPNTQSIILTANYLNNKYNFDKDVKTNATTVHTQLSGISNILRQYTVDVNNKTELEMEKIIDLKTKLTQAGFPIFLFDINKSSVDDFQLTIGLINTNKSSTQSVVKLIIEKSLDKKVMIEITNYKKNKSIVFHVFPLINYRILYGQGSLAKEGLTISGDNLLIKNLNKASFIAAISDGMGNGYMAFQESKSTLQMLDSITNFNISANTSVNILNTFYALKDNLDNYATLDFVEINQINGLATIYKMGASETFILRCANSLEVISNDNLPFGLEDFIIEKEIQLHNHDIIIMISDGIIERLASVEEFEKFLRLIAHKSPQKIVYDILNYSVEKHASKVVDDMSVIVIKVEK